MNELQNYYNEHAEQARQHESHREKMTNLILGVAGVLIGLITFSDFSLASLPAALTLVALGIYGYLFAGKHYERNRFHTTIMKHVRREIDRCEADQDATPASLSELRSNGEKDHYETFKWPRFRGTRSDPQASAISWIARQRLHPFWEIIHIFVAVLGVGLTFTVGVAAIGATDDEPIKVRIVNDDPIDVRPVKAQP
jgi:hypothetical protein